MVMMKRFAIFKKAVQEDLTERMIFKHGLKEAIAAIGRGRKGKVEIVTQEENLMI